MADRIPEGWRECKLGEVAEINRNSIDNEYSQNKILYLDTSSITRGKVDCYQELLLSDAPSRAKRLVKDKDIIYSTVRPIQRHYGIIKNPPPNLVVSTGFIVIETNQKEADSFFIYYFLTSHEIVEYLDIIAEASTSAYPSLRPADIESLEILLPPLPEQRTIASVLSSLDDKIDLLNRENHTLEQMAEALFRQWFIEEADEKWEEVPLSEVFDFKEGPGIRNWQYRDNGIPFINIRLISNGEIDVSKANFVSEAEANAKYKHFYLQRKDMVVSTSGTLGKVAIIRNYHLPLLLNTSVIRFRPKDGINFSFMYGYLRSNEFYECLIDSASGSVQLNFGPIHLKQIVMKIPPNEKLEYFRKVVDPIYEKFELNYNQIRTLEKLRDTLLPKLMSGEVRVKLTDSEVQK